MRPSPCINQYNAEIFLYKQWRTKGFFQFDISISILVSSSCLIWKPMLWVHGHYTRCHFFRSGIVFSVYRRQIQRLYLHKKASYLKKYLVKHVCRRVLALNTIRWSHRHTKLWYLWLTPIDLILRTIIIHNTFTNSKKRWKL